MLTKLTEGQKTLETWTRIVFLIAIIITCVFIAAFTVVGSRINRETGCGWDRIGANPEAATANHSEILDNADDFILQVFQGIHTEEYLKHRFCVIIDVTHATGQKFLIIDQDETVLTTEFAIQGEGSYCAEINVTDNQYIGIKCPKCVNAAVGIVIKEETAGDIVRQIVQNNSLLTVVEDTNLAYTLYSQKDCRGFLRFLLWSYLWLMIALGVILLILVGFRRFEKMLFEEIKL